MTDKDKKKSSSGFKSIGVLAAVFAVCSVVAAINFFSSPAEVKTDAGSKMVSDVQRTPPPALYTPTATPAPTPEPAVESTPEPAAEASATAVSYSLPSFGEITAPFDDKTLVYSEYFGDWRTHAATDFDGSMAKDVFAAADGVVEKIYTDDKYGLTLVLSHADGCKTRYSSLADTVDIAEGDSVTRGDVIGKAGDSCAFEAGQGDHLHFSAEKDGKAVALF